MMKSRYCSRIRRGTSFGVLGQADSYGLVQLQRPVAFGGDE